MLAELQARTAKARAAKASMQGDLELEAAVAEADAAELAATDAAAIADAVRAHGSVGVKIATVPSRLGVIILKAAHSVAFRAFQDLEKVDTFAVENLVDKCVVYPAADSWEALKLELPGVIGDCAIQIAGLAGVRQAKLAGK